MDSLNRVVLCLALLACCTHALGQTSRYDELANLPFENGYPTKEGVETLKDELLFQRAVQSYIWALPALNMYAMKEGSEKVFGKGYNILPIWKNRLNAKTLVTTPNSEPSAEHAPKIEILRARYEAEDGTGGVDVTEKVASLLREGEGLQAKGRKSRVAPTHANHEELTRRGT
jgi:hypothetical protein